MRSGARVLQRHGGAAAALWLLAILSPAHSEPLELAVKATFLVKFAPFVEWPPASFPSPNSPVTICVLDDDPIAPLLQRAANGLKDGNRALVVQRIGPDGTAEGCDIFYFEPDSQPGAAIAAGLRNRPVLTATSASGGAPAPAIVTFAVDENRVRFDIDNPAALKSGLEIDSSLLALARNVRRTP